MLDNVVYQVCGWERWLVVRNLNMENLYCKLSMELLLMRVNCLARDTGSVSGQQSNCVFF